MDRLFNIYSAKHESQGAVRDRYDRFFACHAPHDLHKAEVSRYLSKNGFKPNYPNNAPYAVVISHDIDIVFASQQAKSIASLTKQVAKDVLGMSLKHPSTYFEAAQSWRKKKWNPLVVAKYLKEKQLTSTFYFMALEQDDQDFNYKIEELKSELDEIASMGFDIGLHGGHVAYSDKDFLNSESSRLKAVINKQVAGYRNHFLRFNNDTPRLVQDAGFKHDSTLGFAETPGFRNGLCHPFPIWDHEKQNFRDLVEIPLIMMDQSFYKYLGLTHGAILELVGKLLSEIKKVNGVATLLWHNNYFEGQRLKDFEAIIDLMSEDKPWFCTASELVEFYHDNGLLKQQRELLVQLKGDSA